MKIDELKLLMDQLSHPITPEKHQQMLEHMQQLGVDPGSLYQELEMSSRFVDTHRDTSYTNAYVNLHSHSFYELLYCRSNCGAEYLVGTDRYCLQKGDIVLVAPGISHRPLLPEYMAEPYSRDVLWISAEFVNLLGQGVRLPSAAQGYSTLLRTAGTPWEFLGELFRNGVDEAEKRRPGWELAVIGNTITILTYLQRAFLDRNARSLRAEKPELLDQVMAYVAVHLSGKITLADVAHHFFISESTISQTFRKKLGVSFYRYVTQRRLIAAKTLIERGLPMEEVSIRSGFTDYSVFYRAFKQEYGISPRQYRNLQDPNGKGTL